MCAAIKEGRERTLNPIVREWLGTIMAKHIALERFVNKFCTVYAIGIISCHYMCLN